MLRVGLAGVVSLVVALVLPVAAVSGQEELPFDDATTAVGLTASATPNIDVAVELSQQTFAEGSADSVLIGRSDLFADSLSSGVAQSGGPLLLVPTDGPVPTSVREEIERLGASTAIIFGGEVAVSDAVATELTMLGLTVQRVSGASRTETAVDTATTVMPDATTAVLARSGGVEGNPTSAFADTLGAGALAAINGWPVLLTQTEVLTGSTREYLSASGITEVVIVGGEAAVTEAVADEVRALQISVRRLSGPDRAATAVAIAGALGFDTSADVDEVIVVDGFSDDAWAAGFAAAARAAALGAPVVLGNIDVLPPATADFLVPGPDAITCALSAVVCDAARQQIGFVPAVPVEVPPGSVVYTVDGPAEDDSLIYAADVDGTVLGLAHPCAHDSRNDQDSPLECTEIDFDDTGSNLAVLNGQASPFSLSGLTLGTLRRMAGDRTQEDDTYVSIDAYSLASGGDRALIIRSDSYRSSIPLPPGAGGQAGCECAGLASFQSAQTAFDDPQTTLWLQIGDNGDLRIERNPGKTEELVQRRPGSQLLGAAWSPVGDGDIAIVDVIGGEGLLRIDDRDGGTLEAGGVDVNSTPYWGASDSGIAVLADTDDGVSLVLIDPATGANEVVVDDAGPAAGNRRIAGDASGTFFAWRTADDIRVLDLRSGDVSVIAAPDGLDVTGGPAFRP